jgi:hypothetical protein
MLLFLNKSAAPKYLKAFEQNQIMIGDRPYRSFAHDPRGEEVLLAGESGFAAYRLKAEPRWGDKGFSCALSKVQSVQLNMGTSGDHVVVSPNIFKKKGIS